ncbi:MAG: type IV secretion system DNA-binding domain-containing protein [Minisyncoccia bacterium]
MYLYDKNRITYFAETDRRNKRIPFGIKADDRTRHMYIIGKTGMGKSTLIENMVVQDVRNGEGFAFIDPHGKSAALLLDYIPDERIKDVVYFAPFDTDNPISFNVMEDVGPDKRHLVANGLMSAFKKIWGPETWSARMEYILMNALLALLEYPESTLLGVSRMLTDKVYRKKVVDNVKDPSVKSYWVDEFAKYSEQYAKEAVPGIQNKLGQFTSNPLIRNIIGQPHSSFDLRKMMDERKILIVNLSKGQLGEGNANLLGGMIITKIYLAAMSRADLTESELKRLPNFYMYVDEFQSFANESFADILSEARKYKLALVVAHQYIKQMDEKVADAVFGNVGTQIMFRVGAPDAEVLEKEYAPVFTAEDMVSLGFTQIYLKLMIDGVASHPFSAVTIGPIAPPKKSLREEVLASSRASYGHPREKIEKAIADWYTAGSEAPLSEHAPSPRPAREVASRVAEPRRESSLAYERPVARPTQPLPKQEEPQKQSVQAPRAEKLEKPFAQAFKKALLPEPENFVALPKQFKKEIPKTVSQSTHTQAKPATVNTTVQAKGKSPTAEGLSGLKAALADVLEEEKKKPSPTPPVQAVAAVAPTQPVAAQKEPQVVQEKKAEQKTVEEALTGAAFLTGLSSVPDVEDAPPPEKSVLQKVKEVPEDILMAILRGDD